MSVNQYFSTLIVNYLVESHSLRSVVAIEEKELIMNISSTSTILGMKDNIAFPSENKLQYVEQINKNNGTIMIVLDNLVGAGYIVRKNACNNVYYQINMESDYIKKYIKTHGIALKYISHPAYGLKRNVPNDEESLSKALESLSLQTKHFDNLSAILAEEVSTPKNQRIIAKNSVPRRKKQRTSESSDSDEILISKKIKKRMPRKLVLSSDSDSSSSDSDSSSESNSESTIHLASETDDEDEHSEYESNQEIVSILDKAFIASSSSSEEDKVETKRYVTSDSDPHTIYGVTSSSCTCPAFRFGKKPCKHMNSITPQKSAPPKKSGTKIRNGKIAPKKSDPKIRNDKTAPTKKPRSKLPPIEMICSLQSESDPNTYYNIYNHSDGKYTCVCPDFKFNCVKNGTYCKHILGFLNGAYDTQNPDVTGYVVKKDGKIENIISFSDDENNNYVKYIDEVMDDLYDGSQDVDHFTKSTVYLGWCDLREDSKAPESESS